MPAPTKSEQVPEALRATVQAIVALTDEFCDEYLTVEYAQLCRYLAAALARKRPSPLTSGKAQTWACGIAHALGSVNFLFDSSQTPHLKAADLYEGFGVSQSSGQTKSKQIRDLMNMEPLDPHWCLPSKLEDNPMVWLISVNGFMVDARQMPRVVQEDAFQKGLIPYVPETISDQTPEKMPEKVPEKK